MWKFATLAALSFVACTAADAQDFQAHKVPIYQGAHVQPTFTGSQAQYRNYRTAIRWGYQRGKTVAGHYSQFAVGCGTGCATNYFVDMRNGRIVVLPVGGEYDQAVSLNAQPDSSLILVQWYDNRAGYQMTVCTKRLYVLTDRFVQVGKDIKSTRCNGFL